MSDDEKFAIFGRTKARQKEVRNKIVFLDAELNGVIKGLQSLTHVLGGDRSTFQPIDSLEISEDLKKYADFERLTALIDERRRLRRESNDLEEELKKMEEAL